MIYVVDSNDRDRVEEAADELQNLMREDGLRGSPVLILANKQDIPGALSVHELVNKLGMHSVKDRKWFVQASSATSGDGLYEGLDWLSQTLDAN